MASTASLTLRSIVGLFPVSRSLTSCWVIVEAPCTACFCRQSIQAARPIARTSMPGSLQNPESSTAIVASGSHLPIVSSDS